MPRSGCPALDGVNPNFLKKFKRSQYKRYRGRIINGGVFVLNDPIEIKLI